MQELDVRKENILKFINQDLELFYSPSVSGAKFIAVEIGSGVILDKILNKKIEYESICGFNLSDQSCQSSNILELFGNKHKLKHNPYLKLLYSALGERDENKFLSLILTDIKVLKNEDQCLLEDKWKSDFSMFSNNPINIVLEEKDNIISQYYTAKIPNKSDFLMMSKSLDFKNDDFCFDSSKDFLIKNGIDIGKEEFSNSFPEIIKHFYLLDY